MAVREGVLICFRTRPTSRGNSGKQLHDPTGIDLKCDCRGFICNELESCGRRHGT